MTDAALLEPTFTALRPRLRSLAYRMLGSFADADDALQETWLSASRADVSEVRNLDAWLTTVAGRICLMMLRSRRTHGETSLDEALAPGNDMRIPDAVIVSDARSLPEAAAEAAETVGLAMLIVLQELTPDERLAFVLHDTFAVPFDDIAEVLGATPASARKLASRARTKVGKAPAPDPDRTAQRSAVDAFFAAARDGDFDALLRVLHPDVVLRADGGTLRASATGVLRGPRNIAGQAMMFTSLSPYRRNAWMNGAAGVTIVGPRGPISVMAFTVVDGRIVEIQVLADPERLNELIPADVLESAPKE
ncbi:sigma-70 family RNA polymerase sigma factor [Planctomonas sp. JC2975]|uniref:sigma-70 family RNA polymerase sigma factor n=1 Tax=Planctomonas sp. JC2975 TaxID=2729626 RepID=UPI003211CB61